MAFSEVRSERAFSFLFFTIYFKLIIIIRKKISDEICEVKYPGPHCCPSFTQVYRTKDKEERERSTNTGKSK